MRKFKFVGDPKLYQSKGHPEPFKVGCVYDFDFIGVGCTIPISEYFYYKYSSQDWEEVFETNKPKTNKMNNNKLKLYVLALIAFFIICALASCSSVDPTKRYARKYSDMSYQAVMKDSESFTIKSLKEDKRVLKEGMRNEKKKNGKDSKKDRLKKELEELRAKNN